MDPDQILTIEDVAKYLQLKPQTVYKWAQEETIPGAKLGKEWRFRKSILDEWIDQAIILNRAGFDVMNRASAEAIGRKNLSAADLEQMLKEASID